jgi:hypothetical protein
MAADHRDEIGIFVKRGSITSRRDEGPALIAGDESRRPVQALAAMMCAQKRVRTKLKKMASVLKPEFANNRLEAI